MLTRQRLWLPISIALWVVVVWCCWRERSDLIPSTIYDADPPFALGGMTSEGLITLYRSHNYDTGTALISLQQPLGRPIREIGDKDEYVTAVSAGDNPVAIVLRADKSVVIDVVSGREMWESPRDTSAQLSVDGRFIVFQKNYGLNEEHVTIHRTSDGKPLWTSPTDVPLKWTGFLGPDLAMFVELPTRQPRYWNVHDWTPDQRFTQSDLVPLLISRDGRRLLAKHVLDEKSYVYDYRSGERLYSIPTNSWSNREFSPDASQVMGVVDISGEKHINRWDSETGQPLSTIRDGSPCIATWSPDGRYVAVRQPPGPTTLPGIIAGSFKRDDYPWLHRAARPRDVLTIIENATGRRVGQIFLDEPSRDSFERHAPVMMWCDSGLLVKSDTGQLRFYTRPWRHHWKQLMGWSVIPPLVLISLLFLTRLAGIGKRNTS